MAAALFYLKARFSGQKRFGFVTTAGYTTPLRVYAALYSREQAEELKTRAEFDHADISLKIVPRHVGGF